MKDIEEIYQELLTAFTERAGFTPEDGCDLAVRLWAAAAQMLVPFVPRNAKQPCFDVRLAPIARQRGQRRAKGLADQLLGDVGIVGEPRQIPEHIVAVGLV